MLDREKAETARALVGAASISDALDTALDRVIRSAQLRHDVAVYAAEPPTPDELAYADLPVAFDLDDDDVDYEAIYGDC